MLLGSFTLCVTAGNVYYEQGCKDVWCTDKDLFVGAVEAVKHADMAVVVLGLWTDRPATLNVEGHFPVRSGGCLDYAH